MSLLDRLHARSYGAVREVPPLPEFEPDFLTSLVLQQDEQPEVVRVKPGYIHVSSLLSFCPRMWRLATTDGRELLQHPRSGQRVIWALGRAAEEHVRRSVIASLGEERVEGVWTCACKATSIPGLGDSRRLCPVCRQRTSHYGEMPVWDHNLRVVGNPDLRIRDGADTRLVEIKSMNIKQFEELKAPLPDHVFQLNAYARMLRGSGESVCEESIVFYVAKDYSFRSPYKEYHVSGNEMREVIDSAFARVAQFREHEGQEALPPRLPVCTSQRVPFAKRCPMSMPCFSHE